MQSLKKQYGLTLIETLVAFTIMAISIAIILQIMAKGNRSIIISDDYNKAIIIAESVLAKTNSLESFEKTSGTELEKFRWEYSVTPYETEDNKVESKLKLHQVKITVSWDNFIRTREITLSTLRLINDEFIL